MLQITHLSWYLWPCQVSGGRAWVMPALGVISHCWGFTLLPSCKPDPLPLTPSSFNFILAPMSLQGVHVAQGHLCNIFTQFQLELGLEQWDEMPRTDAELLRVHSSRVGGAAPLWLQHGVLDCRVGMAAAWPGCSREGCKVGTASSRKVHLEQTDDSSAAAARGRADPSTNMGELRMSWGRWAGVGASGAPGSTGGQVPSLTHQLTLGTSAIGCRGGKQETAVHQMY